MRRTAAICWFTIGGLAGLAVLAGAVAGGTSRAGENPTARFVYVNGVVSNCPSEEELKNTVSARLGYDPFRDRAESTVAAEIRREGHGLRARVELRDAAGKVKGARQLSSRTTDCTELSSAVALAISIAIDPLQLTRPAPLPPPPSIQAPPPLPKIIVLVPPAAACPKDAPPPPPPLPPATTAAPSRRFSFRAFAGALASYGTGPGFGAGLEMQAGFRTGAFSLSAEGRIDFDSSTSAAAGTVSGSILAAGVSPCFHVSLVQLCAVALAGAFRASRFAATPVDRQTSFYGAAGPRVAVEIPLYRFLAARIHADLLAPFTRITLKINGDELWVSPSVSGALGAGLIGRF